MLANQNLNWNAFLSPTPHSLHGLWYCHGKEGKWTLLSSYWWLCVWQWPDCKAFPELAFCITWWSFGGCIEMKCPSSCENRKISVNYLKNGTLSPSHPHFTQVQLQCMSLIKNFVIFLFFLNRILLLLKFSMICS